jgi:nucleoside-diphosphate-sugar epimerase
LAAHLGARSAYGRTKLQLEQLFTAPGDVIVKPGTIIGNGGIFERFREMIRRLPVMPLLFGDRALQIVWIGDVCHGIVETVKQSIHGTVILAHPQPVPMREFYRGIAAADGIAPKFLPLSGNLALSAVSLAERLGLRLPITSENLLGIKYIHYFDPNPDLTLLGIQPLDFEQSLQAMHALGPAGRTPSP